MGEVVQSHVRKRGFFGKIFKFLFIAFNALMLIWVVSYWVTLGGMFQTAATDATKTGMEIGAAIGTGALLFLWVAGAIILGLITMLSRGSTVVITNPKG
jgi:hypothetical protein